MGVIKRGILGGFAGKVANVVGTSWKGIAVMKSLPLSVANPKTAAQVAQRSAFSACTKMGSALLATIIKPLWDRFAQQASGYNDFVSANVGFFSALGVPSLPDLIMSRGSLFGCTIVSAEAGEAGTELELVYSDDSGTGNALATDELYVTVVNNTTGESKGFSNVGTRQDTAVEVDTDNVWTAGDEAHVYMSFRRPDGTIVSDSVTLVVTIT